MTDFIPYHELPRKWSLFISFPANKYVIMMRKYARQNFLEELKEIGMKKQIKILFGFVLIFILSGTVHADKTNGVFLFAKSGPFVKDFGNKGQGPWDFNQEVEEYSIQSPNKKINVKIQARERIQYSVFYKDRELLIPSPLSLTIDNERVLGKDPQIKDVKRRSVQDNIYPVIREKRKTVTDHFNEITLRFLDGWGLIFKLYDDGLAYRFFTEFKGKIKIIAEKASFRFKEDHSLYFPFSQSFHTSFENNYSYLPISEVKSKRMGFMPVLVDVKGGPKVAITEADLVDYPGMFLTGSEDESPSLFGKFSRYPKSEEQKGDRNLEIKERENYIALTEGTRTFPWRVIVIAEKDGDLVESDIVYRLASPLKLDNVDWIKPGKVAWDWWNANNIYGVNFQAGINTETYMYYIDFASKYGLEYVILDEGWSDPADLFKINPEIDMEKLLAHAKRRNVGIILWCVWLTLDRQLEQALDLFEKWGIKGIKVDFMNRDDQKVVRFYHMIAEEAAKRRMIVDFHGAYKPTGLRRAYPNVLTREGVLGLEHSKWSRKVTPEHDLTIPFIRMLAGPMDFTPGAMINAQQKNFQAIFERPMSQGTRTHQLAMYVVYESPLQMLCDSPSNYSREEETMEFLSRVPTVWDETKVLEAKVGDYIAVARKRGGEWYVGAMTDWTPRKIKVDCGFLEPGIYKAEIYADGPNAKRFASDYTKIVREISADNTLELDLAPGGGWAARIFKPKH
jgi:alpha-glucosidase